MPKRKGLGTDISKSEEIMEEIKEALKKFAHMPLKKGLRANGVDGEEDKAFYDLINKASENAFALINQIDDLQGRLKGVKDPNTRSSRFAADVVRNFLGNQL